MNFFQRLASKVGFVTRESVRQIADEMFKRSYGAAQNSRLTSDWIASYTSADAEIKTARKTTIARSREQERNNEYAVRFFKLLDNNVLGSGGIGLQMKIQDPNGDFDTTANDMIEDAWADQCKPKNFTASGDMSKRLAERLILRSAARDSGALVRILRGDPRRNVPNARGYAIQLLEIDQLDHDYDGVTPSGNQIRMGVEFDQWRRPIAYHIFNNHPGDFFQMAAKQRDRISAADLIHVFLPTRIGQSVGIPWITPVLLPLKMLAGYEEAELIAAREAACKGYAIENEMPPDFHGEQTDSRGNPLQDMEPGMGLDLSPGQKYVPINPLHPTEAFGHFVKSKLRGIASGLGVSYNSLASDLEGVNYSSIRAGVLEEREEWKAVQEWFIESFENKLFEDWLETQLAFGLIKSPNGIALPASKFDKFNKPQWKPRRWPWVDPLKDMQANVLATEKGFASKTDIVSEDGKDIEDVFKQLKEEKQLAKDYGLEFPTDIPKAILAPAEGPGSQAATDGTTAPLTPKGK